MNKPYTLFIADLHLDRYHSKTNQLFFDFMSQQAPLADSLYILGDFFEMWVGDDMADTFTTHVKACLKELSCKIPVYFLRGNRDFLIGKKFIKETGCQILPDCSVIKLYDEDIVVLHGDELCTLDPRHMQFRRLTRNNLFRTAFLMLPLSLRKKMGSAARRSSRQHHPQLSDEMLKVVPSTVEQILAKYQVTKMIHGHIHQPRVFNFQSNNKDCERIVLGSWERQGCALKWFANGKREMLFF